MRSRRSGVNRRLMALAAPAVLAIPNYLQAQVQFTAAPTGDWNFGGNWVGGAVPGLSQNVQISNNNEADILNNENVGAKTMLIGTGPSNTGLVVVNANSTLTLSNTTASVVNNNIGSLTNGAGTLFVNGGQITGSNEGFNVGGNSSGATGTIIMSGGTIALTSTASYSMALGVTAGAGTLILKTGLISLDSNGTLGVGRNGTGYLEVQGGTLAVGGIMQVTTGGTGLGTILQKDGTITANIATIASKGSATYTMNGGTLSVTQVLNLSNNDGCSSTFTQNGGLVSTGTMDISVGGVAGALATYTQTAGKLAVGTTMIVGGSSTTTATGTFNQTGGFLSAKNLTVGAGANSKGVMNFSGNGSIQLGVIPISATFSNLFVGTTGNGTFNLCSLAAGTTTLSVGTIQVGSVITGTNEVDSQFLMGSTTIAGASPTTTVGTVGFGPTDNSAATNRLFSMGSGTLNAGLMNLTSYNEPGNTSPNQATFQQLGGTANISSMTFAGGVYQVGGSAPVTNSAAISVNQAGTALFGTTTVGYFGGGTINSAADLTFSGSMSNAGATLTIAAPPIGTGNVTLTGPQNNSPGAAINVTAGRVFLEADGGPNLTFNVATSAVIGGGTFVNATENLNTLAIASAGSVGLYAGAQPSIIPPLLLHVGTLSIAGDSSPTATLDLVTNDAIVDNGSLSTIRAQIISGRGNGSWTGLGITSSRAQAQTRGAIGYATVASIGTTTFDGVTGLSPSAVLLKYTLLGDANLDGIVNALDFNALATNYGNTTGTANWVQGDYTYDGTVNSDDFSMLAANFGGNVAASGADLPDAAPAASLGTLVPEPMSLSLIALSGVGLMQRRRRA